jgi:hypothetical protein
MSRGHGKVQRQILAVLNDADAVSTRRLAEAIYDRPDVADAQLVATRRALRGLETKRLVVPSGRLSGRRGQDDLSQTWRVQARVMPPTIKYPDETERLRAPTPRLSLDELAQNIMTVCVRAVLGLASMQRERRVIEPPRS